MNKLLQYIIKISQVNLDLSNYETKSNVKKRTGVGTLAFANKIDWIGLKSDFHESDIRKLRTVQLIGNVLNTSNSKVLRSEKKITCTGFGNS